MIAVTSGYSRVSKADDESKNLDTQFLLLAEHGIRSDLVFSDVASGRNLQRAGWQELMTRVQEGDTIVVALLDRISRNFEDGVRIQAELTRRNIGIVFFCLVKPAPYMVRNSQSSRGRYTMPSIGRQTIGSAEKNK